MNHVKALLIKFVMIAAVLLLILTLWFNVPFTDTLIISLALTALAYLTGDLMIFLHAGKDQTTRNTIATISDFLLAFLVIWLIGYTLTNQNIEMVTPALISALIISGGEWLFHLYVDQKVVPGYNDTESAT